MENEKKFEKIVGENFEALNLEDMANIQGAGDVDPEITPATPTTPLVSKAVTAIATLIASGALSAAKC